jgi:hypothetical protein
LEYRRTSGFPGNSGALNGVQFSWTPLVVPPDLSSYDAVVMCQGIDNEYDGEGIDLAFKFEDQGLAGLEKAIIRPANCRSLLRRKTIVRNAATARNTALQKLSLRNTARTTTS